MKTKFLSHSKVLCALACALAFNPGLRAGTPPPTTNSPTALPEVGVIASDGVALEGTSSGAFTLLRHGSTSNAVTITVAFSGTASNGVDYGPITNTYTIGAGDLALDIPIVPIIDTNHRGNKTVVLTIETNADYSIFKAKAHVKIIDDIYNVPPPTISIVTPEDGTTFTNPTTITVTADASDADVPITSVSFYANDFFIGSASNAVSNAYTITLTNEPPGHYALFARAVDAVDQSTLSAPVHITVTNIRPVVTFVSPTNGAKLPAGNIALLVTATETNGTIKNVSFFSSSGFGGDRFLGTVSNSPYGLTWSNVTKGSYRLYATALDKTGDAGYTDIAITVTNAVTITNPVGNVVVHK